MSDQPRSTPMTDLFRTVPGPLPYLTCDALGAANGFSTRIGGVSTIPHLASLNLGEHLDDAPSHVAENRRRFFSLALGRDVSPREIVQAKQIHSATVTAVTEADLGREDLAQDGFVTATPRTPLFIRTADCCPILFSDPIHHVIGAAHGGWRGSADRIAAHTVSAMCALGAEADSIIVAIGPCIHVCCYEVGEDFVQSLLDRLPASTVEPCLRRDPHGRPHADLTALNRLILLESGIRAENIHIAPQCTCCDPETYFSHRASKGKRGLMGAIIELP